MMTAAEPADMMTAAEPADIKAAALDEMTRITLLKLKNSSYIAAMSIVTSSPLFLYPFYLI